MRGAEATATTHGDENEEGKTRGGLARRGSLDGPPASGGFASTTSVDDDWRGVGDNRSENRPDDEENDERDGGDAEMLDEGDDDDDDEGDEDDDASDVRFIDRGAGEASTPRHADGTFGLINSFVKNVFRAPRARCVSSQISNLEPSISAWTTRLTNVPRVVSPTPFFCSTDDQCWICLDGDTAGREVRTRCERCERRRTATTTETREPDGTEPNGGSKIHDG